MVPWAQQRRCTVQRYQQFLTLFLTLGLIVLAGCGENTQKPTAPSNDVVQSQPPENDDGRIQIGNRLQMTSALPDEWRSAVWREVAYALSASRYSQGAYGTSTRIWSSNGGRWFAGDWNYSGRGIGKGGQCKTFAAEIVRRATGGRYSLPTGYRYATGDIAWCRPGDIIQKSDQYGVPHTAIVFAILAHDSSGRATKIDVIDSNWIGDEMIGRHIIPWGDKTQMWQFKVW